MPLNIPHMQTTESRDGQDDRPELATPEPSSVGPSSVEHSKSTSGSPPKEPSFSEFRESRDLRDRKRKGVSFLSRIIGNRNRNSLTIVNPPRISSAGLADMPDGISQTEEDSRPEGVNASLFSGQRIPQYIKVRAKNKQARELSHLFLAQRLAACRTDGELEKDKEETPVTADLDVTPTHSHTTTSRTREPDGHPIRALEMSTDGRYLAAGSQDGKIRVWAVISTPEERDKCLDHQVIAPVFQPEPFRTFVDGHTAPVLDFSWSKNNFLISSSSDKTVRLWHVSRDECLCMFRHSEMIPSVRFHPSDDRFFIAGSLDAKVRLWSIPDRKVAFWSQLPAMITAVSFSPDGSLAVVGTGTGMCLVFETKGMIEVLRVIVRSSRGKNSRGSRITGIATQWANEPEDDDHDAGAKSEKKAGKHPFDLLISSNDSRIRLYRMRYSASGWTIGLEKKFKGHVGAETQMRASFGEDGRYVVSGSEDKRSFIWQLGTGPGRSCINGDSLSRNGPPVQPAADRMKEPAPQSLEYRKHPVEMVESNATQTTAALLASPATRLLLAQSFDPVYELCQRSADADDGGLPSGTRCLSRIRSDSGDRDDSTVPEGQSESAVPFPELNPDQKPTPDTTSPPSLVDRSHPAGPILICADASGSIAVFRQDCAHNRRPSAFLGLVGLQSSMSDVFASAPGSSYANSLTGRNTLFLSRVPSIRSYLSGRTRDFADDGSTVPPSPAGVASLRSRAGRSGTAPNGHGSGRSTGRSTPVTSAVNPSLNRHPRQSQSLQSLSRRLADSTLLANNNGVSRLRDSAAAEDGSNPSQESGAAPSARQQRDKDADRLSAGFENRAPPPFPTEPFERRPSPLASPLTSPDMRPKSGLYPNWTVGRIQDRGRDRARTRDPGPDRDRVMSWRSEVGQVK